MERRLGDYPNTVTTCKLLSAAIFFLESLIQLPVGRYLPPPAGSPPNGPPPPKGPLSGKNRESSR